MPDGLGKFLMQIEFDEVKITATFLINERKVHLARLRGADYSCRNQLHILICRIRTKNTNYNFAKTSAHGRTTNDWGSLRNLRANRTLERLKSSGCTNSDST